MRTLHRCGLVAALACGLATGANAQTAMFLSPERPEGAVGQAVMISALRSVGVGPGSQVVPAQWPTERIDWMFVRSGGGQQNFDPGSPVPDAGRAGPIITIEALDAAMIGVDLAPRDEEMPGKALAEWARAHIDAKLLPPGLDALEKADKVIVRRVESAKTFVRGRGITEQTRGNRPVRSATATDKSGQAVEIRPMLDPTSAVTPTDLPVRSYTFGDGAKFALLRVVHVPTGDEQRLVGNDKGIVWVRIEHPGEYRLEIHALKAYTPTEGDGSKATWALQSATATFTVPDLPHADEDEHHNHEQEMEKSR